MAFHFSPKIVRDGLVLYLDAANIKSYVSGSTAWNDLTPNRNNGTLTNGPTFDSANAGSIVFDGTNDFIDFGPIFNFTSQNFSFSYWINFNSLTTNQSGQGAVVLYKGRSSESGYYNQIDTTGRITFVTNQPSVNVTDTATNLIQIGNWYNILYTRNGTSMRIYLNGIDVTLTSGLHNTITSSSENFRISNYDNGFVYGNFKLATFMVHNRSLTPAEALQNYNATKGRYGL
jgi:hypothetical protein